MSKRCPNCGEKKYGLHAVRSGAGIDDTSLVTCFSCGFVIGSDYLTLAEAEAALAALPEAPSYAELVQELADAESTPGNLARDYMNVYQEYAELLEVLREIRDLAQSVPEGEGKWVWTGDGLGLRIDEALDGKEKSASPDKAPF